MRINFNKLRRLISEAILNAYDVLGVRHNATEDEIKSAWKKLAIQNHPDRGGSHGKMVDINQAKERLLNKMALFRHGPMFKGYEDPTAPKQQEPPKQAQAQPQMVTCEKCNRNVAVKDGKRVGHYTQQGGTIKCEGSFKPPINPYRERDFWNDFQRQQSNWDPRSARSDANQEGGWRQSAFEPGWEYNSKTGYWRRTGTSGPGQKSRVESEWKPSTSYPGYEYNYVTGNWRKNGSPGEGSRTPPRPPPQPNEAYGVNGTYLTRGSKFWKIILSWRTVTIETGTIGRPGSSKTYRYHSAPHATQEVRKMIDEKIQQGWVRSNQNTNERPPDPGPQPPDPDPQPAPNTSSRGREEAQGQQSRGNRSIKDTYKVYGWKNHRRVVRVGGKLYGTGPGGSLSTGGQTRFNANDRARVSKNGTRMTVKKTDSDHTQTWDPIDEVKQAVDLMVVETLAEIVRR